ncbi:MAG: hypothetical protein J6A94_02205 [Lachnospiraceae bacterium]|nr:hypothetical protein [Lachnospiraceae bacterium]
MNNKLYEDLLYVKSLITAMGNLNIEEMQLQSRKVSPVKPRLVLFEKIRYGRMIRIFLLVFLVLFFINTIPFVGAAYRYEKTQIELDKENDMLAWRMAHKNEEYPGYQGEENVNMVSVVLPIVIRGSFIAFVISGMVAAIMTIREKMKDARNSQLKNNYENSIKNNQLILQKNAEIDAMIQHIANRRVLISEEYMENIIKWYPKDYGYPSAVNFFINLVENHMANTIQECVEQYNTYIYRQQKLENQQKIIDGQNRIISQKDEMIRQQMIGNYIANENLYANRQTAQNTSRIADATERIARRYGRY